MLSRTGYFTGNGTSQSVPVGFAPEVVIIKSGGLWAVFKTLHMPSGETAFLANGVANFGSGIFLSGNGFSVGDNSNVNAPGATVRWWAVRGNGQDDFACGYYDGDGQDDRDITGLGFEPDLVAVKGDANYAGCWRTDRLSGDTSMVFGPSANSPDQIQGFGPDGFQVGQGSKVNNSAGYRYNWFALRRGAGHMETGSYQGTGGDDRHVSVGFPPCLVWVKSHLSDNGVLRFVDEPSNESLKFYNEVAQNDAIQEFGADDFVIGTKPTVNTLNTTYSWVAFGEVIPHSSQLPCYLSGTDSAPLAGSQPAFAYGVEAAARTVAAYAAGEGSSVLSGSQIAWTGGFEPLPSSTASFAEGYDPFAHASEAQLPCWLQGVDAASSAQPAWLAGEPPPHSEGNLLAWCAGLGHDSGSLPVFCAGWRELAGAVSAWLSGADFAPFTGSVPAYVSAGEVFTLSSSAPCYLVGGFKPGAIGFRGSGRQLEFSMARSYPVREPRERLQVVARTAAGTLRVADKGVSSVRTIRVSFNNLPASDYQALIDWYDDVAVGALNTFWFVDEQAVDHPVRWTGPALDFEQTGRGRYSGEIVLEEVPS